jgi:formylglycine-generating enzyme required for sulfatase activity
MIYVPTGIFAAGDGTSGNSQFTLTTINTGNPLLGPSGSGSLGGQAGGYPTGQLAPSTATWPNGYNAFYCMKYEISQQGYAVFLNTLNRIQQANRFTSNISVGLTSISNRFVMTNTTSVTNRNAIACNTNVSANAPVKFYCDYNNNSIGGEANDGKEIACNWIGWTDMTAYLAWAGLRPVSELEYEKCGRGNQVPVPGEFAWGNRNVSWATQIIDAGLSDEHPNPDANLIGNSFLQGPLRNGALATATSGREQAGAGYYGMMELTGNLWERIVNLSTAGGRNFAGSHGNGKLDANGNVAGNTDWPTSDGMGGRGGSYVSVETDQQLSSRGQATTLAGRISTYGGRGCRTAQ